VRRLRGSTAAVVCHNELTGWLATQHDCNGNETQKDEEREQCCQILSKFAGNYKQGISNINNARLSSAN